MDIDYDGDTDYDDIETAYGTFPPGQEALLQSSEGGEAIFQQLFDDFKHSDSRIRTERVQIQIDKWKLQLPRLIDAYLRFKARGPIEIDASCSWGLAVLSFSEHGSRMFSHPVGATRSNESLLLHGYLGSSPESPALAFPIQFFEILRQLRHVCPRFSLDAMANALSHIHHIPRNTYLKEQLSDGYDAYLAILRGTVCPPCLYKTVGEPQLKHSFLATMDGNNSLKLVDATFRAGTPRSDDRKSTSFRWLSSQQVDAFKDEVENSKKSKSTRTPAPPAIPTSSVPGTSSVPVETPATLPDVQPPHPAEIDEDDIAWLNINEFEGEEIDELKKMKYPLAITDYLLKTYGEDIALGYDIMCAFFKTLLRSSLGTRTVVLRLRGVVPAFHGHAHSCECQIGWHPLYVEGMGLEDFEECERTFAKSNHLASVTQMATPFHRQQAIDEYFYFHDLDKHTSSGNFIFQNYRQALEKISANTQQLEVLEEKLKTLTMSRVIQTVEYMDLLKKLRSAEMESEAAKVEFRCLDYNIINNGYTRPQIAQVRRRYGLTAQNLVAVEQEVGAFEDEHEIVDRWAPGSKAYEEALVLVSERSYRLALDRLELLVVKRMFELTKLGMNGVGYKMREKISKALRTRAEAIRTALNKYNIAASQLNPPRPRLSWAAVIETVALAEFDLLRDTRSDIRQLAWAQPANREASVLYFGIKGAKEEIRRLNVEIVHLITFMVDDHVDYVHAIRNTVMTDPDLSHEISQQWIHRSRINESIALRLVHASCLRGFSGSLFPGIHVARDPSLNGDVELPGWATKYLGLIKQSVEHEELDIDEEVPKLLEGAEDLVLDLMERLSTVEITELND
ncbi:hypothetical protein C8J57DRAFT_1492338 [Mycena rebaudengoi]|nr:hypothetical protein C8J57DRAFT_1492338 [Mycena rebaudengoi]